MTATEPSAAARRANWPVIFAVTAGALAAILAALLAVAPRKDGAIDWFAPMIRGGWMAWTLPVALFFYVIGALLVVFTLLAIRFPDAPRVGILRIETTRGDRLFISLLGSAFVCWPGCSLRGHAVVGARALSSLCRGGVPLGLGENETPTGGRASPGRRQEATKIDV
jgi:Predicted small integral membrane protein